MAWVHQLMVLCSLWTVRRRNGNTVARCVQAFTPTGARPQINVDAASCRIADGLDFG